jgi:hypothetical protein
LSTNIIFNRSFQQLLFVPGADDHDQVDFHRCVNASDLCEDQFIYPQQSVDELLHTTDIEHTDLQDHFFFACLQFKGPRILWSKRNIDPSVYYFREFWSSDISFQLYFRGVIYAPYHTFLPWSYCIFNASIPPSTP